jgi:hypothetical protein
VSRRRQRAGRGAAGGHEAFASKLPPKHNVPSCPGVVRTALCRQFIQTAAHDFVIRILRLHFLQQLRKSSFQRTQAHRIQFLFVIEQHLSCTGIIVNAAVITNIFIISIAAASPSA